MLCLPELSQTLCLPWFDVRGLKSAEQERWFCTVIDLRGAAEPGNCLGVHWLVVLPRIAGLLIRATDLGLSFVVAHNLKVFLTSDCCCVLKGSAPHVA